MFKLVELFIGFRYTQAKRRNQFISFVSLISLLGMILGVFALIVVLSVMNGFESELRGRILSVLPHGYIDQKDERLTNWQHWQKILIAQPHVKAVAPYIDGNVMLNVPGVIRNAKLTAIDPLFEKDVSSVAGSLIDGNLDQLTAGSYTIVMGDLLARYMRVSVGDVISVMLPKVTVTPVGIYPRVKRFKVVGIFSVGAQLDSDTVFIHLKDGQKLFQYGDRVKGVRVEFDDILLASNLLPQLLSALPETATSRSWEQSQGSLFQAMKMEKMMVTLLLLVIVTIAALNIISILTMMVADKRSDIAVLRTMGMSPLSIRNIFMIQGMVIGFSGIVIGVLLGVPVALYIGDIVSVIESLLGAAVFNPDVYFISKIPSVVRINDVAMVVVAGFLLSLLATVYPAIRASKVHPAEALRYE